MRTTSPSAWRKITCRETHRSAEWRRASTALRATLAIGLVLVVLAGANWASAGLGLAAWVRLGALILIGATWWMRAAAMRHQLAGAVVAAAIAAAAAIVTAAPQAVTDRLAALVRAAAERAARLARAPQDACRSSIGVAITSLLPRRSTTIGAAA